MLAYKTNLKLAEIPANCVLFFKSSQCISCQSQLEIFEESQFDFIVQVIDEECPEIGMHFNVMAVPVLIYIKDSIEVERSYGVKTIEQITRNL